MASVLYYEASLYEQDIDVIDSGWLTSNAVDLFLCYLEKERFSDHAASMDKIAILHPGILLIIALTEDPEEMRENLDGLDLPAKDLVLLPVNDASSSDRGSHWSLLVFDARAKLFTHYDSIPGGNKRAAQRAYQKMRMLFDAPLEESKTSGQQDNGSDCGLFLCMNAENLVSNYLNVPCRTQTTPEGAAMTRKLMMDIVNRNRKQ